MSAMVRAMMVSIVTCPAVQSIVHSGQRKIGGPDSITSRSLRAAEAFARVLEEAKPSGLTGKIASEFFCCDRLGFIMMSAGDVDFENLARESLAKASEVEQYLDTLEPKVEAAKPEPAKEEDKSDAPVVDVPPVPDTPEVKPDAPVVDGEAESGDQPESKPDDVPVEKLAEHGIPAKVIEVLVAAGLPTAKSVRERDAQKHIDDLTDIGTAIRKKILAAIDAAIA